MATEAQPTEPALGSGLDSEDELEMALEAAMEHKPLPAQSADSDDELEAALLAEMESEPSRGERSDRALAEELQAEEYGKEVVGASQVLRADGPCWLLLLPEELQRRVFRFVSIANLLVNVRVVSKFCSVAAIAEVRERVRGLLHDALVTGFETEAATNGSAAASSGGGDGSSASAESGSATSRAGSISGGSRGGEGGVGGGSGSPDLVLSEHRRRLVALAEALEAELTRLAASCEQDQTRMLTSKCRSICFNLSDSKNPELRARLLSGELTPAALVRLSSQEMASGSLRAQRHQWHAKRLKCAIRCAAAVSEPTREPPLVAPPLCRSRWSTVRLVVCSPFAAGRSAASASSATCTVAIGANLIRLESIAPSVPASGKLTVRAHTSRASIATTGGRKEAREPGWDRSD